MKKYAIYCTPEQTKRALELGAPIKIEDTRDRYSFVPQYSDSMGCRIKKFEDAYKNCYCDETAAYLIPTAEEMIGWLEKQGDIDCIEVNHAYKWSYDIFNKEYWKIMKHNTIYQSRKEATLAAIDAALEFLDKRNKK